MNEYNRITGYLSTYTTPGLDEARLRQHMDTLGHQYNRNINTSGSLYRDSTRKAMTKHPKRDQTTQTHTATHEIHVQT